MATAAAVAAVVAVRLRDAMQKPSSDNLRRYKFLIATNAQLELS